MIESHAQFSDCRKYRYYLVRVWNADLPKAMVVGLNPSTAGEEQNDPTITNLIKLLQENGYGGFYMVNLFALISPYPEDLRSSPDPLRDNDYWLSHTASLTKDVIFAWGAFKQAEYRAKKVIAKFPNGLCFGKSKKGHPIHPLAATVWMKKKCKLQPYKS